MKNRSKGKRKKMKIKYLILDFGKVLAYPVSGHWFITPACWKILDKKEIQEEKLKESMKKYNYMLDEFVKTEKEEFEMFRKFYKNVLKDIEYKGNIEEIAQELAQDCVYNNDKYRMYEDVKEKLQILSKKYRVLLLSDNWPSALRMLKDYGIEEYFEKIYISSICESRKKDKIFFDFPTNDFNIKKGEAIFVDDNIQLLDIAKEKGLIPILMDREMCEKSSRYPIINSLQDLIENNIVN